MTVKVHQLAVGGFDNNFSYLGVAPNGDSFIVDPCGDAAVIHEAVHEAVKINPRYILLTHRHGDHISALEDIHKFFPAPIMEFANLTDGQLLPLGNIAFEAIFTPGHTRDSVCYRLTDDSAIFTGDTIFIDYIGFCEPVSMYNSLYAKLAKVAGSNIVYSGHNYGSVPFDTLEHQRQVNPYLRATSYEVFLEELDHLE